MLTSYENCPVCNKRLRFFKRINTKCPLLAGTSKMSFLEGICNDPIGGIEHNFFQITSLYGEKLFEKIGILAINSEVEINYHLHKSVITYFSNKAISYPPEKIEVSKLIELDYSSIDAIANRIKKFKIFL